MAAPTYISGSAGDVTFGSTTYHVQKWDGKITAETASVMTTGSGGWEEIIPTKLKLEGNVTFFFDPAAPILPTLAPGTYFTFTLKGGTHTTYSGTALITSSGMTLASDKEITQDVSFGSTGAVTVA